jgi:site-specific recombinase XerD
MPIQIQSTFDYKQICDELGITIDDLITLQRSKAVNTEISNTYENKKILIIDVIAEFKNHILLLNKNKKRSDSTIKTYINFLFRLDNFIQEKNSSLTIEYLNEDILMEMLNKSKPRKGDSLSINTFNKYQSILRKIVFFCYDRDYINKDLRYRFPIHNTDTLPRYLTLEQLKICYSKALQRSYGYRCRAMLIFLSGTGCRVSELVNMKVKDFNIKEKIIYVYNGKGKKDRTIPMFSEVEKAIMHYLRLSGVPQWNSESEGYLFCRDEGISREKKISVDSVQYLVRNIFKTMQLSNDFTVHSFRHTFAVNCLKSGINLQYLTQILGHTDPKTTQIYLKLHPVDLKEAVMKHYPFPFENLLHELFS